MTDGLCVEQTWRGNFWLPENPDHAQQGFLTYSPHDGVTLSLVGGFNDRERIQTSPTGYMRREGSGRFSVIHGAVGSGMPVTLVDCRVTHSPSSRFMDHIHDQDITVAHALTGVLLKDPEAPVFSKLAIELENLTEWDRHDEITVHSEPSEEPAGRYGSRRYGVRAIARRLKRAPRTTPDSLASTAQWHAEHGRGENWRVHVDPLKPLSVTVGELTVELVRRYHEPKFNIRRDRLETTATTFSYLDIRSSQPKSMAEWFEVTKALQDLLTLAMDAPCALLSETLTPAEELLADESARSRSTVDVFGEHILVGERDTEGVTNMEGLFTLGTEGVEFDQVITQWLRIHADFRTTCDMIFGLKYVKDGYAQTKLITAVAAAESLHEALGVEPPITDEEFQTRCSKLLHSVPKEERPWLSDKLGSNRHALRQRLLYLAAIPDSEVMAAILPNPIAWARAARDERDPVAHGGNMTRDIQLLSAIITTTTAVVLLNLLHQLGIPKKRLKMALDHNRTMKSAKYLANKQWPAIES